MEATVNLRAGVGSEPVTDVEVIEAPEEADVAITDDVRERVASFIEQVSDGKPLPEPFTAARGEPATDARDESLDWDDCFDATMAKWSDGAQVDFYSFNSIVTVEEDALIGKIGSIVSGRRRSDRQERRRAGLGQAAISDARQ